MIITVTLNPAVDKTINIKSFQINSVNRVLKSRKDAGGKGINVSKVLKELGTESIATGFLGGDTGDAIRNYLNKVSINDEFLNVDGNTRENIKIVDPENKTFTDINDIGPKINKEDIIRLKNRIKYLTENNKIIVFSGSIPHGCPKNIYLELIQIAHKNNAFVILDTYGKPFNEALKAKPNLIKPNIKELEEYFNRTFNSTEEMIRIIQDNIIKSGIDTVVVSLGKEGAVLIEKDNYYKSMGLDVSVKSTVGAGDAMVAGIAYSIQNNLPTLKQLVYGSAAATANIMTTGTQTGDKDVIEELLKKIITKKGDDLE